MLPCRRQRAQRDRRCRNLRATESPDSRLQADRSDCQDRRPKQSSASLRRPRWRMPLGRSNDITNKRMTGQPHLGRDGDMFLPEAPVDQNEPRHGDAGRYSGVQIDHRSPKSPDLRRREHRQSRSPTVRPTTSSQAAPKGHGRQRAGSQGTSQPRAPAFGGQAQSEQEHARQSHGEDVAQEDQASEEVGKRDRQRADAAAARRSAA